MPELETVRPLKVSAPGASEIKISNRGLNGAYYGRDPEVSVSKKIGTLNSGEILTVTKNSSVFLIAEKTPTIIDLREIETLGGGSGITTTEITEVKEAVTNIEKGTWIPATDTTGVDPTGATDSTTGLLKAIEAAYKAGRGLFIPGGKYKIGESGTGLDFKTIAWKAGTIEGVQIECDQNAVFEGNAALGTNPIWNIEPKEISAENIFALCKFNIGSTKRAAKSGGPCVRVNGFNEGCELTGAFIFGGTTGLLVVCNKAAFTANSTFRVGGITSDNTGILLESEEVEGAGAGIQSNTFYVNDILATVTGIEVDTATGHNSRFNRFSIGAIGQAATNNFVNNGNDNRFDFGTITGSATNNVLNGRAYVRGFFEQSGGFTGTSFSASTSDVWDSKERPFRPASVGELQTAYLKLELGTSKKVEALTYEEDQVSTLKATSGEFTLEFTWKAKVWKTAKITFNSSSTNVALKLSEAKSGAESLPASSWRGLSGQANIEPGAVVVAQGELYGAVSSLKINKETLAGGTGEPTYTQKSVVGPQIKTELNDNNVRVRGKLIAKLVYEEDEVSAGATSTEGEFTLEFTWQKNVYKTAKIKFNATEAEVVTALNGAESGAKKLPKVAGEPFKGNGGTLATKVKVQAQNELYGPLSSLVANKETLNGTPSFIKKTEGKAITNGEEAFKLIPEAETPGFVPAREVPMLMAYGAGTIGAKQTLIMARLSPLVVNGGVTVTFPLENTVKNEEVIILDGTYSLT